MQDAGLVEAKETRATVALESPLPPFSSMCTCPRTIREVQLLQHRMLMSGHLNLNGKYRDPKPLLSSNS